MQLICFVVIKMIIFTYFVFIKNYITCNYKIALGPITIFLKF